MLPYLIAGAIGFVVAKLLEEDKSPKYADGGQVDIFKSLFIKNGFTQDDLQRILEENENYFNQIEFYDNETIIVYRTIALPRRLVDKFIALDKKEIGEGIGEYWTLDKEFGSAVWGGGHYEGEETFDITCVGHLKIKDIDWEMMKYAFNDDGWHFGSESEIRGVNGGNSIKVVKCEELIYRNGGLIAPNGKPSKLTPEQYKLVRTPAFKKWFGDWENSPETASKVVDENGEPLVVYHGSYDYGFTIFSKKYRGNTTGAKSSKKGFFFYDKKEDSEQFAKKSASGGVYGVFLKIKYPNIKNYNSYNVDADKELIKLINSFEFDGAIALNIKDGFDIGNQYVVFEPEQIKLADGTNTKFDGNNPDIRYEGGGEIEELKFSNKIESDAMGYDIGDYLYHITPVSNFNTIIKKGFIPKNGISINNKPFENRLYFATSLISAYDLSVNFGSYRDNSKYVIFKIKSDCINDYEEDDLFAHGIYVDYKVSNKCIVGYVNANDLFNKFDDEDIENLYY